MKTADRSLAQILDSRRALHQLEERAVSIAKVENLAPADALIRAMELNRDLAERLDAAPKHQDGFNPSVAMLNRASDICWAAIAPYASGGTAGEPGPAFVPKLVAAQLGSDCASKVMQTERITADQALRVVAHVAPALTNAAETLGVDDPAGNVKVVVSWTGIGRSGTTAEKSSHAPGVSDSAFVHNPEPHSNPKPISPGGPQSRPYVPYDPARGFAMDQLQAKADELAKGGAFKCSADALLRAMELNPELARAAAAEAARTR